VPAAPHGSTGRFVREISCESYSKAYTVIFLHVFNVAVLLVLKTLRHQRKTQRNLREPCLIHSLADYADESQSYAEGPQK
jgi:hypothetical protein